MKNYLFILLLLFYSLFALGQENGYRLLGEIQGLRDSTWVFLVTSEKVDSTTTHNNRFIFKGDIKEPSKAVVILYSLNNYKQLIYQKALLIDAGFIQIKGPVKDFRNAKISSLSQQVKDFEDYEQQRRKFDPLRIKLESQKQEHKKLLKNYYALPEGLKNQNLRDEISKTSLQLTLISRQIDSLENKLTVNYLKNHPTSYSAFQELFERRKNVEISEIRRLWENSGSKNQNTETGKLLQKYLINFNGLKIGDLAPDFSFTDMQGEEISLRHYRGKYVLLEFWGSWCSPCRGENPKLNELYERYKGRGFEILGMGMDDKEALAKAIKMDKITWRNIVIPEGFNSTVAMKYGVSSAPSNFLIDPAGKIVAQNLREAMVPKGDESLSNKLDGIFKSSAVINE
jgi:peroxiredoxin